MLISEINGWHYIITWDNPVPADSRTMLAALAKLGRLTTLNTKTTVALSPKRKTTWQDVRRAIESNLHPTIGNVVYVNLKTGKIFHRGKNTKYHWRSAP